MNSSIGQYQHFSSLIRNEISQLREETVELDRAKEERSQQWMSLTGKVSDE
jgi:hypothetical protein